MEEYIDKIASSPHSFKTFNAIKRVFDAFFAKTPLPAEPSNEDAVKLLEFLGLKTGLTPNNEMIQTASELVDCLIISADAVSSEDDTRKRARSDDGDKQQARVAVDFERFEDDDIVVDPDCIMTINEYQKSIGEPYVDPQFPPTDRSLYPVVEDGQTWACSSCARRSPLPPLFDSPTTQQEATVLESRLSAIRCDHCGASPPYMAQVQFMNRPAQWLRPSSDCELCNQMYGQMAQGQDLKCRMCPHYLRDPQNHLTIGAPWKVIREKPRPEDVVQGALGNCWFAGALSVCTQKEGMIENLISSEFNPYGAYLVTLFHSGQWRRILIDDLFPTNKVFQGRFEGIGPTSKVYYSRGGTLSYLQCNRRQLWVPLVEKAAAKLYKSYGALGGGTFAEALSLFSGYPTEQILLTMSPGLQKNLQEQKSRRAAMRMQLMLQGRQPPPDDDSEERELEEQYDEDIIWTKLLSFKDAGYLMGMGLTAEGAQKTKEQINDMGLQAPHAYGILDIKEITVGDKAERLIQVRNPWGERAPRTWKGDWGKDSAKWTLALRKELGVVNASNVKMYDEQSIFWMSFTDVKSLFHAVEVCRVHDGWNTSSENGWLCSGVGPGNMYEMTVYDRTPVDIVLWQEKHVHREASVGALSTNVDVGIALLKQIGSNADGTPEYTCIETASRGRHDFTSIETVLDGGFRYLVVPLCFSQMEELAPRKAVCVVHAHTRVDIAKKPSSWDLVAQTLFAVGKKVGKAQETKPGIITTVIRERSGDFGWTFLVENRNDTPHGVQYDCSGSEGLVSSRQNMSTIDVVPPKSRMVLFVLSVAQNATRMSFDFGSEDIDPEMASMMGMVADLFHLPRAISPLSLEDPPPVVGPDAALLAEGLVLRVAREENDNNLRAIRDAKNAEIRTAEEGRKEAARLEKEREVQIEADRVRDDEEALRVALAMSTDPKEQLQVQIQLQFEAYVSQGMDANQAAVKALEETRRKSESSK